MSTALPPEDAHLPITRCPHCRTAFRVREIQLTQRRGMVRCGACRGVFNAIQNMLHVRGETITIEPVHDRGDAVASTTHIVVEESSAQLNPLTLMPERPSTKLDQDLSTPTSYAHAATPAFPAISIEPATQTVPFAQLPEPDSTVPAPNEKKPIARTPTMPPIAKIDVALPVEGVRTARAMPPEHAKETHADLKSVPNSPPKPQLEPTHEIATDVLEASLEGRAKPIDAIERFERSDTAYEWPSKQSHRARWMSVLWAFAAIGFVGALIAQVTVYFRNDIVSRLPGTRSTLTAACGFIGCTVSPPERPLSLVIDGSELTEDPSHNGLYVFSATLRNRHTYGSAYPHLVLTLTGLNNQALSRRTFAPNEYLSANADLKNGLNGNSETEFKIWLDVSQIKPIGFDVRLAYLGDTSAR